ARPILMSHLGRPKGKVVESLRMAPVAKKLQEDLDKPVVYLTECVDPGVQKAINKNKNAVILLENLRFYPGERENLPDFSRKLAELADIYCNDAFGTSHRAHASTVGVTAYLPSVMGLLMEKELNTLSGYSRIQNGLSSSFSVETRSPTSSE
ncbi:MAG: phosphoglycerate kinase, partial [Actinobacteria bacterium]|nr:phosphoglycerate kinase [Actinomycetota bacterium]